MDSSEPATAAHEATSDHNVLSAVSNEMVRIYKDQFGRGPTKTRTQWAGPDVLVVTLEQTLTAAERRLVDLGEHGRLRDLRLLFQYAQVGTFCEPIERLTGRVVKAFISGIDTEADLASELFVFYPEGHDGASRRAAARVDLRHGST